MPADKPDSDKQPGFKVSDRRIFSESGDPKPAPGTEPPAAPKPTASTAQPPAATMSPGQTTAGTGGPTTTPRDLPSRDLPSRDLPSVDFHTFILSLGSSALLHLGELDQSDGTESGPDLPMAKHTIDIIAMLQEKTKGNLSPPEERLIESLLYDLRLRFVERSKTAASG